MKPQTISSYNQEVKESLFRILNTEDGVIFLDFLKKITWFESLNVQRTEAGVSAFDTVEIGAKKDVFNEVIKMIDETQKYLIFKKNKKEV